MQVTKNMLVQVTWLQTSKMNSSSGGQNGMCVCCLPVSVCIIQDIARKSNFCLGGKKAGSQKLVPVSQFT